MREQSFSYQASNDGSALWFQRVPKPIREFTYTALTLVGLASVACTGGGNGRVESPRNHGSQPETTNSKISERVLPISGLAYLTQGEHAWDDSPTGVMSSIDVAPTQGGRCPASGARFAIENQDYVSMVSGKVVAVGNQNDRNDPLHSVVRVQEDGTGIIFEHMHDDEIPQNIRVGEHVTAGQKIGKASCEVPRGGLSTGPHAHVDVLPANADVSDIRAERLPIRDMVFSGWRVNGDGLIKGQDARFANEGRCGPDENSIKTADCNGKRNDLADDGKTEKTAVITPTPTATVETAQQGFPDPYQAALDFFVKGSQLDPAKVLPGEECRRQGRGFCIVKVGEGKNVVYYLAGPYQTDGSPYLFVGRQQDGSWKAVYFDNVSRALGSPGPNTRVKVIGAGDCLNVRDSASLSGKQLDCLKDGTRLLIDGGPVYQDGYVWFHLTGRGWSVVNYLGVYDPSEDYSR